MARVRWQGKVYSATPVRQDENGDWLMVINEHGPRFAAGTEVRFSLDEIVEMAAAEMPASPEQGLAELDRDMAEERKTLPSVTEVLGSIQQDARKKRAEQDGSEPGPT